MMLPMPTNGETIPPKANPSAPNKAEAVPALLRSQSIAKVLEAVKVSPSIDRRQINSSSYIQKLQSKANATKSKADIITIPKLPQCNACSKRRNLMAVVADMAMKTTLIPKHTLNSKGENP